MLVTPTSKSNAKLIHFIVLKVMYFDLRQAMMPTQNATYFGAFTKIPGTIDSYTLSYNPTGNQG